MTDAAAPPAATTVPRTVLGPVTLHEKVRGHSSRRMREHPLRCPWPAGTTFVCEPHRWGHEPGPTPESPDPWPEGVRLTVTCPDLEQPVTTVAFEFKHAEQTAFFLWRKRAPCHITGQAHRWEPRGLHNGAGFCGDCDLFAGDVIDLAEIGSLCVVCHTPTWWSHVKSVPGADDDEDIGQARLVCRDCCPPATDDLLSALRSAARAGHALDRSRLQPWLAGYVTNDALWGLADSYTRDWGRAEAVRVLRRQIQDARAHLVDQLLAAELTPDDVQALPAAPFVV